MTKKTDSEESTVFNGNVTILPGSNPDLGDGSLEIYSTCYVDYISSNTINSAVILADNLITNNNTEIGNTYFQIANPNTDNTSSSTLYLTNDTNSVLLTLNSSINTANEGSNSFMLKNLTGGKLAFLGSSNSGIRISSSGIVSLDNTTSSTSNSSGALLLSGGLSISNTTDASSASNGGTFTTAGGIAIAKSAYIGGAASIGTSLNVGTTATIGSTLALTGTTDASSISTGILQVSGGVGIAKSLWVGTTGNIAGALTLSGSTSSTSSSTGILLVSGGIGISNTTDASSSTNGGTITTAGGLAVAKATFIGTSLSVGTTATIGSTLSLTGTTDASSTSTGILQVSGGAGIAKSLWVGTTANIVGALTLSGTTSSSSNSTGILLLAGGIGISNTTDASSSTNGGTITTAGGLAVAKSTYIGTSLSVGTTLTAGSTITFTGITDASSSTTGILQVSGGVGIAKSLWVGTNLNVSGQSLLTGLVGIGTTSPILKNNVIGSSYTLNSLVIGGAMNFPPIVMTGNTTVVSAQTYGNGTYIASASVSFSSSEAPWNAFDTDNLTTQWSTTVNSYNSTTGVYVGSTSTTIDGTGYLGEWLELQLPVTTQLTRYILYPRSSSLTRSPNIFYIAGSNDGSTWTMIDSRTGISGYTTSGISFSISSNILQNGFLYYRIVVNQIGLNANSGICSIAGWVIYASELVAGTTSSLSHDSQIILNPMSSTLSGTLTLTGNMNFTGTSTDATSTSTGTLTCVGGISSQKNIVSTNILQAQTVSIAFEDQSLTTLNTASTTNGSGYSYTQNSYITLTTATNSQANSIYWQQNPGHSWYCKFDLWYGSGSGADGFSFCVYQTALPTDMYSNNNGFAIQFSEFHNNVVVIIPSGTSFSLTSSYTTLVPSSTWATVAITFTMGLLRVYINTVYLGVVEIQDSSSVTQALNTYTTITGSTGGFNNIHRIRNIEIHKSAPNSLYLGGQLNISSPQYGSPSSIGKYLILGPSTFTDNSTASSGTASTMVFNSIAQPTLSSTNTSVTTTNAATLYIAGSPLAGTNETITNSYGIWNVGNERIDGTLKLTGSTSSSSSSTGILLLAGGIGISNTTDASSASNGGTFTTAGGIAVAKSTYIGTSLSVGTTLTAGSTITFTGTTDASSSTTGILQVTGGVGIAKSLWIGTTATIASTLNLTGTTSSTSNTTGILTLAGGIGISNTTDAISSTNGGTFTTAGGIAVAKSAYIGGAASIGTSLSVGTTLTAGSTITFTGTTDASSISTGILQVSGGVGIAKSLWVGTTTNITGALTLSGSTSSTSSSTGILLSAGGIGISNTTDASSSTNGGTITTAGGIAIAKSTYIGTSLNVGTTTTIGSTLTLTGSTTSTSNSTGVLLSAGGIGISNTTDATSSTNGGTFTTAGGIAIAKSVYVGTALNITNSSSASVISPFTSYTASMPTNGIQELVFGRSATTNDAGYLAWNNISAGTSSNYISLGTYNNTASLSIYPQGTSSTSTSTGTLVVHGDIATPSNITVGSLAIDALPPPTNSYYDIQFYVDNTDNNQFKSIDITGKIQVYQPTLGKGEIPVNNGTTYARLPAGTAGQILAVNTSATLGVEWHNLLQTAASTITDNYIRYLDTYDPIGGLTLTYNTWSDVILTNQRRMDDPTFTTSDNITYTITETGTYFIQYTSCLMRTASNASYGYGQTRLVVNTGSGFVDAPGTDAFVFIPNVGGSANQAGNSGRGFMVLVVTVANTQIKLQAQSLVSGTSNNIMTNISSLSAIKIISNSPATDNSAYFDSYDSSGGLSLVFNTFTDILMDNERKKDSIYTHSNSTTPAVVTVTQTGYYIIIGKLTTQNPSTSVDSQVQLILSLNTGSGFTAITGETSYIQVGHQTGVNGQQTTVIQTIMNLTSGNSIKMQAQLVYTGESGTTVANASQLCLMYISNTSNTQGYDYYFDAYGPTSSTALSSASYTDIPINTIRTNISSYYTAHSSTEIQFTQAGTYYLLAKVTSSVNNNMLTVSYQGAVNSGTGYFGLDGSDMMLSAFKINNTLIYQTSAICNILYINTGTLIKYQGIIMNTGAAYTGATIPINGLTLSIIKIEQTIAPTTIGLIVYGSFYQYDIDTTTSSTTSTALQTKMSYTSQNMPTGTYKLSWYYECYTANSNMLVLVLVDGVVQSTFNEYISTTSSLLTTYSPSFPSSGFAIISLQSGVHTVLIQYASGSGTSASIKNVSIELFRIS